MCTKSINFPYLLFVRNFIECNLKFIKMFRKIVVRKYPCNRAIPILLNRLTRLTDFHRDFHISRRPKLPDGGCRLADVFMHRHTTTHTHIAALMYSQIVKSTADTRRPTVSVILPRPRQSTVKVAMYIMRSLVFLY